MTSETELMPCPFCGGEAELFECEETDNEGGWVVGCKSCMASTRVHFANGDDPRPIVVDLWNTRAVPDGFVLVPVEPTEEMELSGHKYSTMAGLLPMAKCRLIYKAMIAAAQKGGE